MKIEKYLVIIEKTRTGYSAYAPDVDECVATGATKQDVEQNMREALAFHLEGLQLEGYDIPRPHSYATFIEIAA